MNTYPQYSREQFDHLHQPQKTKSDGVKKGDTGKFNEIIKISNAAIPQPKWLKQVNNNTFWQIVLLKRHSLAEVKRIREWCCSNN